jgi:hypothetical protein
MSRILDLLVYYGWLNSFNSAQNGWNNENVSQDAAKYNLVIFGDGIQDPGHGDYSNTEVIIPRIQELNPGTIIFGYTDTTLAQATYETKCDQWETLGVNGIFMDQAGYDWSVTRAQFNDKVDYIHSLSTANTAFVNAWNMDHIIGTENDPTYPNSTWNPSLLASKLTANDWYLLESFCINTDSGDYQTASTWKSRGDKAVAHRATYNIKLAGLNIINNGNANGQTMFDFCYNSAVAWDLDAIGTSDTFYAAGTAAVTFWTRTRRNLSLLSSVPEVTQDGGDSDVYLRYGKNGRAVIDWSSGAETSIVEKW